MAILTIAGASLFCGAETESRERGFVRQLQLGALLNNHDDASEERVVQALNDIRKEGGSVPLEIRRRSVFDVLWKTHPTGRRDDPVYPRHPTRRPCCYVPLAGATQWTRVNRTASCVKATSASLRKAAGQQEDAKNGYDSLRKELAGRPGSHCWRQPGIAALTFSRVRASDKGE